MTTPSTRPPDRTGPEEPQAADRALCAAPAPGEPEDLTDLQIAEEAIADLPDEDETMPASHRILNLLAILIPFAALVVAISLVWGHGFTWIDLGLFLGMYLVTGLGITVGFHRLFAHRAFETNRVVQAILAVLGSMAVEGPLLRWVATHRSHHQHSDREDDPHTPHLHGVGFWNMARGLWRAHAGWIFEPSARGLHRYVADLKADRYLHVISTLFPLWVALSLMIPMVLAGVLTQSWAGAFLGLLWGGLVRIFFVHHVTWSINSVCHIWGSRPFRTHDHSRNNPIFGVLGFGEGWHNNHHAFPTSARHGLRWWEIDTSYLVIRALSWVGLAWNVRVPRADRIASKRH